MYVIGLCFVLCFMYDSVFLSWFEDIVLFLFRKNFFVLNFMVCVIRYFVFKFGVIILVVWNFVWSLLKIFCIVIVLFEWDLGLVVLYGDFIGFC